MHAPGLTLYNPPVCCAATTTLLGVGISFKARDRAQKLAGIKAAKAEAAFRAEEKRKAEEYAARQAAREAREAAELAALERQKDLEVEAVARVIAAGQLPDDSDVDTEDEAPPGNAKAASRATR